jgi:hypothetical protein
MIRSLFSNDRLCLDHWGAFPGAKLALWYCDNNNDHQRFLLVRRSDGYFNVKSFLNGDVRWVG